MRPYKIRSLSFKKGVLSTVKAPEGTGYNFETVLKYALDDMKVASILPCCDASVDTHAPVAWNKEEERLERWDPETEEYVEIT